METINNVLNDYRKRHDFNQKLPFLAHNAACIKLAEYFKNPKLKYDLKGCENLTQIQNVIEQKTGALSKDRTPDEIMKFREGFERLLKIARL